MTARSPCLVLFSFSARSNILDLFVWLTRSRKLVALSMLARSPFLVYFLPPSSLALGGLLPPYWPANTYWFSSDERIAPLPWLTPEK